MRLRCACVAPVACSRGACAALALRKRCDSDGPALRSRCACATFTLFLRFECAALALGMSCASVAHAFRTRSAGSALAQAQHESRKGGYFSGPKTKHEVGPPLFPLQLLDCRLYHIARCGVIRGRHAVVARLPTHIRFCFGASRRNTPQAIHKFAHFLARKKPN